MSGLRIVGGRLLDPAGGLDRVADVRVRDGRVVEIGADLPAAPGERAVAAHGLVVAPGFIDLQCRLGEGEHDDAESLATASRAAAAGGFTTICVLGDSTPRVDHGAAAVALRERARREALVNVRPVGTITRGGDGAELAELGELAEAGAVAYADGTRPVRSSRLLRHALAYSAALGRPVVEHARDGDLAKGGLMHEGVTATHLGLPGIPAAAEEIAVDRALALARLTGGRLHFGALSTAGAVARVSEARAAGLPVTAAVTAHHLLLDDRAVGSNASGVPYDTSTKLDPPLRAASDRAALLAGLRDGTITAVVSDHQPRRSIEKDCEYAYAAAGASALETTFGVLMELVAAGMVSMEGAVLALTAGPARAFGLPGGRLAVGEVADLVVFDPAARWLVEPTRFHSRGRSTPLAGHWLRGRVVATLVAGTIVHEAAA